MRIGNGPRLVVPRPGTPGRRGWGWRYLDRGQAYDEWRALQRRKWLVMHRLVVAGDVKPQAVQLSSLKPGDHYRLVDAHGRTTGPRLTVGPDDRWWGSCTLVRRVNRQPEDYHSQLSRILKRAHKLAMRED